MLTLAKMQANKSNAMHSTGPRTESGKAIAKMNAVSHGLRAVAPTVPGEDPVEWDEFRNALVADLAPVGFLEMELAERIALLCWRLRRVVRFESGSIRFHSDQAVRRVRGELSESSRPFISTSQKPTVTQITQQIESTQKDLDRYRELLRIYGELVSALPEATFVSRDAIAILDNVTDYLSVEDSSFEDPDFDDEEDIDDDKLPDVWPGVHQASFLRELGTPDEYHDEPMEWDGWTADIVLRGVDVIAKTASWTGKKLLDRAIRDLTRQISSDGEKLNKLEKQIIDIKRDTELEESQARVRSLIPRGDSVEIVMKYEGHLHRQLTQTLHELERRQAKRSMNPPAPPTAFDVTIHAAEALPIISR
jgi:hypothetical protein